jgi:hypothetical protein
MSLMQRLKGDQLVTNFGNKTKYNALCKENCSHRWKNEFQDNHKQQSSLLSTGSFEFLYDSQILLCLMALKQEVRANV